MIRGPRAPLLLGARSDLPRDWRARRPGEPRLGAPARARRERRRQVAGVRCKPVCDHAPTDHRSGQGGVQASIGHSILAPRRDRRGDAPPAKSGSGADRGASRTAARGRGQHVLRSRPLARRRTHGDRDPEGPRTDRFQPALRRPRHRRSQSTCGPAWSSAARHRPRAVRSPAAAFGDLAGAVRAAPWLVGRCSRWCRPWSDGSRHPPRPRRTARLALMATVPVPPGRTGPDEVGATYA